MDANFLLSGLDNIARELNLDSTSKLTAYYETALAGRETLDLNIEGFNRGEIQLDSNVEFAEISDYLRGMATYVDSESEPLARGKQVELTKLSQSIPTQRRKIVRGKNDYKRELLAANKAATMGQLTGQSPYQSVREYLFNNLFDTLKEIPDSHNASLSYQVGQMKSKRKLTLTSDNNQGGLVGIDFEARVPEKNVVTDAWYKKDTDGNVTYVETADPILTLKRKIRELKLDKYHGYQNVTVETNANTFYTFVEHPAILTKLGYSLRPELQIVPKNNDNALTVGTEKYLSEGDEFIKNWFARAIGADNLIVNTTIVGVDKLNATTKKFETEKVDVFDDGVILVRPSGNIGTIYPVQVVRPDASAIYTNIFGGWGILEYLYDKRTREQTWISEISFLAIPTMPKKMFYYEIEGTTEATGSEG
jgi:hypothetical protein